jgi:hypothetical protein
MSHFPRRICVICRCCSAASRNSASRLLARRRLRIASISSLRLARGANNIGEAVEFFVAGVAVGDLRQTHLCSGLRPTIVPASTRRRISPSRAPPCVRQCADGRQMPPSSRSHSSLPTRDQQLRSVLQRCRWGGEQPSLNGPAPRTAGGDHRVNSRRLIRFVPGSRALRSFWRALP